MRFIIREQEYEELIAAGRLKVRTGAYESWRLTEAVDGFLVLRVDIDRQTSGAAKNLLIHVLLDTSKKLERLKLLDLAPDRTVSVDVVAGDGLLSVSRSDENNMDHYELQQPVGFGVLLPGFIGLGLVAQHARGKGQTLAVQLDWEQPGAPSLATIAISELEEETIAVTGQSLAVRPYLIRYDETVRTIYLDKHGIPVRIDDEQGTLAIDDRYMRHR